MNIIDILSTYLLSLFVSRSRDKYKLNKMPNRFYYHAVFGRYIFNRYRVETYDHISNLNYHLNVFGMDPTAEECFYVGMSFGFGYDPRVKINQRLATYWYTLAAERGHPEAMFILANNYAEGIGVKRDINKSYHLMNMAASLGSEAAKEVLENANDILRKSPDID